MDRKQFLKIMALLPLVPITMNSNALSKISSELKKTERMPSLFLGHGSPMNAIEENEFVATFRKVGREIPKPKAILCISAHWETSGTFVTAMEKPRTIHDFGGFPKELFEVQYPAKGDPKLAEQTKNIIKKTEVALDYKWGLDHGAWSVIKHLYPKADIPVIQMSIDYTKPPQYHYELAKEIAVLRDKGVMIIGSGNIVHNLRLVAWNKLNDTFAFDWAAEARQRINDYIINGNHKSLINYKSNGKSFEMAIPTPEHYLPLLYILALKDKKDNISLFNDKPVAGALTMTSVKIDSDN